MVHCCLALGTGHEDIEIADRLFAPTIAAGNNDASDARVGLKIGA